MSKKLSVFFILITIIIAGIFLFGYQKKVFVFSNGKGETDKSNIAFLVLGRTGKVIGWNFAPDLADSIFLVDYHPSIGAVNIISLPRDLYINLGGEKFKLNEVVRRGKINELLGKLPEITGVESNNYIVLDVDMLKNVVDGMGGIDINLKSDAVDWASGYTIKAGQNHLDGNQTVWLVRNRYAPDGDFFREKNQQEVIKVIADKFKNLDAIQKASFLFKMTPEIAKLDTNINFQEIFPLFEHYNNIRFNNIILDFQTGLLQSTSTPIIVNSNAGSLQSGTSSTSTVSAYILIPRAGEDNYAEIRDYIQSKLEK